MTRPLSAAADPHRHLTVTERLGGGVLDLGVPLAGETWQQITVTVEQAEHLVERLRDAATAMRVFDRTRRTRVLPPPTAEPLPHQHVLHLGLDDLGHPQIGCQCGAHEGPTTPLPPEGAA